MSAIFKPALGLCTFLLLVSTSSYGGEENAESNCGACRKVLVFDSGTKITVSLRNPKFEIRCSGCKQRDDKKTTCSACTQEKQCDFCKQANVHDPMMCETCLKKRNPNAAEKPSVRALNQNIAFLCKICQNLCWRNDGKEQQFVSKEDCEACIELKKALTQANEPVCPHCAVHNKPLDTGTKPTANQNIRRPCPECENATDGKVCKTCEAAKIKCAICSAAVLEKQSQSKEGAKSEGGAPKSNSEEESVKTK